MGTSNFYKEKASRYFVVTAEDEMEADYKIERIKEELKGFGYDLHSWNGGGKFFDRAQELAYKSMDVYLEGDDEPLFMVELKAILRYGYYEHASLDWQVTVYSQYRGGHVDWSDAEDVKLHTEEEIESLVEHGHINKKYMDMVQHVQSRVGIVGDTLIEECEKIFSKLSDHELNLKGRFSNGEAVYEKIQAEA